jgi:ABC-type multidrug transport system fused ATPase/permease subunit
LLESLAHQENHYIMREIMYSHSSVLIVSILFICMLLAMEIGFRSGRRKQTSATEAITQANAVLAAMLGLLALLLAFTFSAALQRYENRSQTVVGEANAIGTAYLRARLLPAGMPDEVQALLRRYLDVRTQDGRVDATEPELHESLQHQAELMEAQLWNHAVKAAELDGRVVTSGLFIQSLNELIDASGTRSAALDRHVPEIVLFLMFATIVLTTATLGYASGIAGHRVTLAAFVLVMLIALVVYLIIDLDRPRRGAIQVSHESMLSLQQTIEAAPGHSAQPGSPPDKP